MRPGSFWSHRVILRVVLTIGIAVIVLTTGTPSTLYSVQEEGYTTYNAPVHGVPVRGEIFDLEATPDPTQPIHSPVIGGDIG